MEKLSFSKFDKHVLENSKLVLGGSTGEPPPIMDLGVEFTHIWSYTDSCCKDLKTCTDNKSPG